MTSRMSTTPLYKITEKNGSCCNGGSGSWPLPAGRKKGAWLEVAGDLKPCSNGLHLCRPKDLLGWLNEEIYEAEYDGEIIECDGKVVVRRARLIRRIKNWNETTARLFAADCASRAAKIYSKYYPNDDRVNACVRAVYDFARGKIKREALAAAWAAAWAAAGAAAGAAARAAAEDAARAAAWAAAWAAARDAEKKWQRRRLNEYLSGRRK
jgi:hypothetical protein